MILSAVIHGTTRRQVAAMFSEERPHLGALPMELFSSYQEGRRRVQRDGFVEVAKSWYEAPAEYIGTTVWARWDGRVVRLLNGRLEQIAMHTRLEPGGFSHCLGVRGFHGTVAQTMAHWSNRAAALGDSVLFPSAPRGSERAAVTSSGEPMGRGLKACAWV